MLVDDDFLFTLHLSFTYIFSILNFADPAKLVVLDSDLMVDVMLKV